MSVRILVTGATGHVGAHVLRLLHERDARAVAAVHSTGKVAAVEALSESVRVVDYSDEAQIDEVFTGIDKVFLVTPVTADQVEMGGRLVAAAANAGVRHVVKLSMMGAEHPHGIRLARWHRHLEEMVANTDMQWTFLQPNVFMQNFAARMAAGIAADGAIRLPLGGGAVSYIDARDVAEAAVETLLRDDDDDGEAYTLTGGAALTGADVARAFSEDLGRPVEYVDVPEADAREALEGSGAEEPLVSAFMELWAEEKSGARALVTPTLTELTGSKPRTFSEFIRDHETLWGPGVHRG